MRYKIYHDYVNQESDRMYVILYCHFISSKWLFLKGKGTLWARPLIYCIFISEYDDHSTETECVLVFSIRFWPLSESIVLLWRTYSWYIPDVNQFIPKQPRQLSTSSKQNYIRGEQHWHNHSISNHFDIIQSINQTISFLHSNI